MADATDVIRTIGARSRSWRWTAITGVALLVLVTIHMVAHHFVVDEIGGLRTYQHVLDYIAPRSSSCIEGVFLVVVTVHAMLGLRSVLLDFGLSQSAGAGCWIEASSRSAS